METNDRRTSYNNADLNGQMVNGFKKKATRISNVQIKVGSAKVDLPIDAFLFTTDSGHAFLSLQSINAVLQKNDRTYEAIVPKMRDEAVAALKKYRSKNTPDGRAQPKIELPDELAVILSKIPKGYKLVHKDSGYAMVKERTRTKK